MDGWTILEVLNSSKYLAHVGVHRRSSKWHLCNSLLATGRKCMDSAAELAEETHA